jgi:hypothetical protein
MKNKSNIYFVCLFTFLLSSFTSFAYKPLTTEQASEILNSRNREIISLTNGWQKSYDNTTWEEATVPFSEVYKDAVTYKKDIRIEKNFVDNRKLHFVFPGLAGEVEIYFNNEFITKYICANTYIDVTIPQKLINVGANELKLVFLKDSKLERQLYISTINAPVRTKGIIREPFLVSTSKIWINDLSYNIREKGESIWLEGRFTLSAGEIEKSKSDDVENSKIGTSKKNIQIEYQLINKQTKIAETSLGTKTVTVEDSRVTNVQFNISCSHLKRWEIEKPELYELKIVAKHNGVLIDDYFVNVGIKTFKKTKDKFSLNGQSIAIKAVNYEEFFTSTKNTLSAYRLETDIKEIKVLGANAIRFQRVPHPYLAYLCDLNGLLMFIDIPLNNLSQDYLTKEDFIVRSSNLSSQIINNYMKYPSLVAIGLGNEVIECEEFNNLVDKLLPIFKKYNVLKYKTINIKADEFSSDAFDFIIVNLGDKKRSYDEIKSTLEKKKAETSLPVLFSFSTSVFPNNVNGYLDKNSLEYQAFFIKSCYNISKMLKLAGVVIVYNDYATEYPVLSLDYYNQYINTTGVTDGYRANRLSYSVAKALFNNEKVPLLNAGSYENQSPTSFIIIGLLAVLILLFMLNRYRRFREYFVRATIRPYNFYSDIRDSRILSISQTLILGFLIALSAALSVASILISLKYDVSYSYLLINLLPYKAILETIFKTVWSPDILLLLLTFLAILKLILTAILIRVIAFIVRAKVFFDQAITITIWAALPYIFLLPIGVVIARILVVSDTFIWFFVALIVLCSIAMIFRLLKSLAVVFDKSRIKVYSIGIALLILMAIIPFFFYERNNEILPFINYFCSLL